MCVFIMIYFHEGTKVSQRISLLLWRHLRLIYLLRLCDSCFPFAQPTKKCYKKKKPTKKKERRASIVKKIYRIHIFNNLHHLLITTTIIHGGA